MYINKKTGKQVDSPKIEIVWLSEDADVIYVSPPLLTANEQWETKENQRDSL